MPIPIPAPFAVFKRPVFHIGGEPASVAECAATWNDLARECEKASDDVVAAEPKEFGGGAADTFRHHWSGVVPALLGQAQDVAKSAGTAIEDYGDSLRQARDAMDAVIPDAMAARSDMIASATQANAAAAAGAEAAYLQAVAKFDNASTRWAGLVDEAEQIKTDLKGDATDATDSLTKLLDFPSADLPRNPGGDPVKTLVIDEDECQAVREAAHAIADALDAVGDDLLLLTGADDLYGDDVEQAVRDLHAELIEQVRSHMSLLRRLGDQLMAFWNEVFTQDTANEKDFFDKAATVTTQIASIGDGADIFAQTEDWLRDQSKSGLGATTKSGLPGVEHIGKIRPLAKALPIVGNAVTGASVIREGFQAATGKGTWGDAGDAVVEAGAGSAGATVGGLLGIPFGPGGAMAGAFIGSYLATKAATKALG